MDLTERTITSETVFHGNILTLKYDSVLLPNGENAAREVIEHKGAVAIVAVDDEGRIALVRQYRYAVRQTMWELPAGKLESLDEVPLEAAHRELREETGFTADTMVPMGVYHSSPGFCSERENLFLATGLHAGETDFDEDEFLELKMFPIREAVEMVMRAEITCCTSCVGILKAAKILGI